MRSLRVFSPWAFASMVIVSGISVANVNMFGASEVGLGVERDDINIPPSEFIAVSEKRVDDMRGMLKEAVQYVGQARETNDAIRLNCVNDKTLSMKGILRIGEDSFISLQEAMAINNESKGRYEFSKIRVSWKKMKDLRTHARGCVGAEASYTGGTVLDVDVQTAVESNVETTMDYWDVGDGTGRPGSGWVGSGDGAVPGLFDGDFDRPQVASASRGRF